MIELKGIVKKYGKHVVLNNIDLSFEGNGIYCIIGESGCGKTTLMKLINKLILPTSGRIFVGGKDISGIDSIQLRRSIGYVIQKVGLFPHMTVGANIEVVLELLKVEPEKRRQRTLELLNLVHLKESDYDKYPDELSGGQQQRVGIARALSTDPDILLMDEPFSALDPITRERLQDELVEIQKDLGKTIVFVTHDMDEAIKIADKIAILKNGDLIQYDAPEEILLNPANGYVEYFIGKDRLWRTPELLLVKDIMKVNIPTVKANMNLSKVFEKMKEADKELLFVVDKGRAVGSVSRKRLFRHGMSPSIRVADVMDELSHRLYLDSNLLDAMTIMEETEDKAVVVENKAGELRGVITPTSLLNVIYDIKPECKEKNYA